MNIKLHKLYFRALNKILLKQQRRYYFKWKFVSEFFKKPKRKIVEKEKKINNLAIKTNSKLCKTERQLTRSPIETSTRLYTHAKELQKKKDLLKESYQEEYSFTPKVTVLSKKWLQIKSIEKKNSMRTENIAIVSAQTLTPDTTRNFLRSFTPIL